MKKIEHDLRYDGATTEQVRAMLADPAFREKVCDYQGVTRHTVTVAVQGEAMDVRIDQVQSARSIPSFAKRIVGEEINIVQTEHWSSATAATIEVAIPGKPGDIGGTIVVTEDDRGTTERVEMTVKVSIPLVGGKLEGLVADLLLKALKAEHEVGQKHLAGVSGPQACELSYSLAGSVAGRSRGTPPSPRR